MSPDARVGPVSEEVFFRGIRGQLRRLEKCCGCLLVAPEPGKQVAAHRVEEVVLGQRNAYRGPSRESAKPSSVTFSIATIFRIRSSIRRYQRIRLDPSCTHRTEPTEIDIAAYPSLNSSRATRTLARWTRHARRDGREQR